jgi:PTH2 family peptidyl-tRNA hydrolase
MNNPKQVIVLRKDLNMRKGKMVAQGAHASMKVFFDRMVSGANGPAGSFITMKVEESMIPWIHGKFTKICVSVNSEQELLDVYQKAKSSGIACSLVQDAGLTEFGGVPTYTAVAVGPDVSNKIDEITGKLPLL